MPKQKSYYELLKHPKWQKKRLEILRRANFECENCGADEITLHVHHTYYEKGCAPWEYPDESLQCLCEKCHRETQDLASSLKRHMSGFGQSELEAMIGYALGLRAQNDEAEVLDVFSYEVAMGVGHFWNLSAEEVIDALDEGQIDGTKLSELSKRRKGV